ncbi:hypothetical protein ACQ4PT_056612 [Festuca glaucescens]
MDLEMGGRTSGAISRPDAIGISIDGGERDQYWLRQLAIADSAIVVVRATCVLLRERAVVQGVPRHSEGFFCERRRNIKDRALATWRSSPPSWGSFPVPALFHANSNKFGGAVPDLIALRYFYDLKLAVYTFPTDVLGLTNSTFIDIWFNSFYGELPARLFCSFPLVETIFINNSQFSGLPVNYLSLANNRLTGPIAASIPRLRCQQPNTPWRRSSSKTGSSAASPTNSACSPRAINDGTNQLTCAGLI